MYWNHKTNYFIGFSVLLIWSAGCTLDSISGTGGPTTSQEDLQTAGRILGESLSSDESGVILSLNDALTSVSSSGFMPEAEAPGSQTDRSGRGKETNYSHVYRQQTGTHLVSFDRRIEDALFTKTVTDSLNYQFRDGSGNSIKFPQQEKDRIAFIHYNGQREGEISTLHKQSFFVRKDTFIISGVNASALSIDGVHHGEGTIEITPSQAPSFQRWYKLKVNLLNISITPLVFNGDQDIWRNVSGTLSWQLTIRNNANDGTEAKNIGGTIKLAGAGTALVKFYNEPKRFQLNLNNGDVKDQEKEFEGRVRSVNLTDQSITLFNGRILYLVETTDIDEEDYSSLRAVEEALAGDRNIWAEGEGSIQDNQFIVSEIEFEREEVGDEDDDSTLYIEFEESITAVDIENQTFTLANKIIVLVNDATDIDDDSDYLNLQEVANALNNGTNVTAEGKATQNAQGSISDLTAVDVEFERDAEDDDNNDNDEDD